VTLVFLPAHDIATYVSEGNVDMGITGLAATAPMSCVVACERTLSLSLRASARPLGSGCQTLKTICTCLVRVRMCMCARA
jgi:hypothetical protein